jgi:1,4-dihydroxy-2-naphthoate octaprenyltransferase
VRLPFIPASLIPVFAGLALAWSVHKHLEVVDAVVTVLGIALAHMSADLFNDYFDYKNGTDQLSRLRGLSGGSGVIVNGLLTASQVKRGGFVLLGSALLCGIYLSAVSGPLVLLLMLLGAASIYGYTSILQRIGFGEFTLALERIATVMGAFYVQTGLLSLSAFMTGLILGSLSIYMVYYAAFPDFDADRETGKKTLVVLLNKQTALKLAPLLPIGAYALIFAAIILRLLPLYSLLTLVLSPLAYRSLVTLSESFSSPRLMKRGLKEASAFTRLFGVLLVVSLL